MGTVVTFVSTVLTSCKSETKQEEISATFIFDQHHTNTGNEIKEFFNKPGFIFNPNVDNFTVGETNEEGKDFVKYTGNSFLGNVLISNSERARKLLFNENFFKFCVKGLISALPLVYNTVSFSDTPMEEGWKSLTMSIKFSENEANLYVTLRTWRENVENTEDDTLKIIQFGDKCKISDKSFTQEYDTTSNWCIGNDINNSKHLGLYGFSIADYGRGPYSVANDDWASIKALYNSVDFPT